LQVADAQHGVEDSHGYFRCIKPENLKGYLQNQVVNLLLGSAVMDLVKPVHAPRQPSPGAPEAGVCRSSRTCA
jgi:hypothetical protein